MRPPEQVDGQQHDGHGGGGEPEYLGHPNGRVEKVQAVGTQAFDASAAHTVPGKIAQKHLTVELAPFLGDHRQQDQSQQVPQGLVEKGWVDLGILQSAAHVLIDPHTPRQIGRPAVSLNVHEIAPAAHQLADEQAEHAQIRKG